MHEATFDVTTVWKKRTSWHKKCAAQESPSTIRLTAAPTQGRRTKCRTSPRFCVVLSHRQSQSSVVVIISPSSRKRHNENVRFMVCPAQTGIHLKRVSETQRILRQPIDMRNKMHFICSHTAGTQTSSISSDCG